MAGIYIHIPFCKQKCTYCDFHFSTTYHGYRSRMIVALLEEIRQRKDYLKGEKVDTIYFGGGTPSLLTQEELSEIVQELHANFQISPSIEFTLEANPDDIDENQLKNWKKLGVNRLSVGIQSFFQEDLDWMNRAHNVQESYTAVELAKKHDFLLTLDLIYGLPNHTLKELEFNIQQMLSLNPPHISAYCLTVEKGTGLDYKIRTKQLPKVGEDEQADEFEFLSKMLQNNGYEQYEISNFAKNGGYSIHNSNYWKGVNYIGIGPSAHSFNGTSRQWNIANNHLYMRGVLENESYSEKEILTPNDQFNELILTGLRTKWGINLDKLRSISPFTTEFNEQLQYFEKENLIQIENNVIFLTQSGKLQADYIASNLFLNN